ncbi:MAG TPA: SRPBCC family protein [Ktedonobacterales bacterium]
MSTILKSVDVNVPIRAAYNQWTQFESFPHFMEGIKEIRQLTDSSLHWVADLDGQHLEWDAKITEELPNIRVAWTSTSGAPNGGAIDFHYLAPNQTRIVATMDVTPQGVVQNVGDWLGVVDRRVQGDLDRFKTFIEGRGGQATGAWTGTIEDHPQNIQPGMPG